ncbi:MAG TPA: quinol oxidase [Burkholderiales bacterium]|nr:quinol oxidase [Burkholderiales bacterium]
MQRFLSGFICCITVVSSGLIFADTQNNADIYTAIVDKDGVQHVRILGGSYFFKPNRIVVKKNVPVVLSISVESGIAPHSIVAKSPEAGIAFDESLSSTPKNITFTATAAGEYVFYCKNKLPFLPSHREKGMHGVIEVVE